MKKQVLMFLAILLAIPLVSAQTAQGSELIKTLAGSALGIASLGFYTFGAFLGAGAGITAILIAIALFLYFWYLLKQILYDFSPLSEGVATIIALCFVSVFAVSKAIGFISNIVYGLLASIGRFFGFLSTEQSITIIGLLFFALLYYLTSWLVSMIAKRKIDAKKLMNKIEEEAGKTFMAEVGKKVTGSK